MLYFRDLNNGKTPNKKQTFDVIKHIRILHFDHTAFNWLADSLSAKILQKVQYPSNIICLNVDI